MLLLVEPIWVNFCKKFVNNDRSRANFRGYIKSRRCSFRSTGKIFNFWWAITLPLFKVFTFQTWDLKLFAAKAINISQNYWKQYIPNNAAKCRKNIFQIMLQKYRKKHIPKNAAKVPRPKGCLLPLPLTLSSPAPLSVSREAQTHFSSSFSPLLPPIGIIKI